MSKKANIERKLRRLPIKELLLVYSEKLDHLKPDMKTHEDLAMIDRINFKAATIFKELKLNKMRFSDKAKAYFMIENIGLDQEDFIYDLTPGPPGRLGARHRKNYPFKKVYHDYSNPKTFEDIAELKTSCSTHPSDGDDLMRSNASDDCQFSNHPNKQEILQGVPEALTIDVSSNKSPHASNAYLKESIYKQGVPSVAPALASLVYQSHDPQDKLAVPFSAQGAGYPSIPLNSLLHEGSQNYDLSCRPKTPISGIFDPNEHFTKKSDAQNLRRNDTSSPLWKNNTFQLSLDKCEHPSEKKISGKIDTKSSLWKEDLFEQDLLKKGQVAAKKVDDGSGVESDFFNPARTVRFKANFRGSTKFWKK